MGQYEYKVIAAPEKGLKAKGVKSPADRFALALTERMNEMAADGWAYLRTDTLPSIERSGLTSTQTVYRNVMVFRRPADMEQDMPEPTEDEGRLAHDPIEEPAVEEDVQGPMPDSAPSGDDPAAPEAAVPEADAPPQPKDAAS